MLKGSVRRENGVVWLNDRGCDLWSWVDTEFELAFLAVVDGQALHEKSTESRARATTKRVEHQEALKARAVVRDAANFVQDLIDELLAHGIVASSIIVRGILFASDHVLRVEELAVRASTDLVDNIGLEIAVDGSRDIFALAYDDLFEHLPHCRMGAGQCLPVSEKKVLNP